MKTITRNQGRILRKTTAGGLVLLLVLAGLPALAAAEGKVQHWSKVQAVTPGTEIKVELYKDQAPRGSRKIQGRFHSATDDSITLRLKGGQRRTLQKHTVRKVLAYRSFEKRYQGWLAGAAGLAVSGAVMANSVGAEPGQVPMMLVIGTFVPMVIGFLAAPKMGKIYSVPPKHRIKPPGDKQSGSASKASGKQEGPTPKTVE